MNSLDNQANNHVEKQVLARTSAPKDKFLMLLLAIFIFVGGFKIGANFSYNSGDEPISTGFEALDTQINFSPLSQVWETVNSEFLYNQDIDNEQISYGLAKGLIASLNDPHSEFLDPKETEVFTHSLNQELEGIGAELTLEDGLLKIVTPLKGSPAEKAGLRTDDIIIEINHESTLDYSLFEAIQQIRGKKGTPVDLTIARENVDTPIEVTIIRDIIEIESVTGEMQDGIYYISINQFSNDTSKEFSQQVNEVLLSSPKGVILDLRYNGGGYLQTAIDILGEFLPQGSLAVVVESKGGQHREELTTVGKNRLANIPVVVLINKGSASASEILAGALQDAERATIIGVQSYGKGTVQQIESFRDGSSLKLTIAKWITPKGHIIEKTGITPDQEVLITEEDIQNKNDSQLKAAKEYLQNYQENLVASD